MSASSGASLDMARCAVTQHSQPTLKGDRAMACARATMSGEFSTAPGLAIALSAADGLAWPPLLLLLQLPEHWPSQLAATARELAPLSPSWPAAVSRGCSLNMPPRRRMASSKAEIGDTASHPLGPREGSGHSLSRPSGRTSTTAPVLSTRAATPRIAAWARRSPSKRRPLARCLEPSDEPAGPRGRADSGMLKARASATGASAWAATISAFCARPRPESPPSAVALPSLPAWSGSGEKPGVRARRTLASSCTAPSSTRETARLLRLRGDVVRSAPLRTALPARRCAPPDPPLRATAVAGPDSEGVWALAP